MKEFFTTMESLQAIYWYIACGSSFVFILLTVASLVGGGDADMETHAGEMENPLHLLSLRNIVNFLLGFGWSGVAFYSVFSSKLILGLVSLFVGCLFALIFLIVIKAFLKLSEDNTVKIEDMIGKTGNVYLKIPPLKGGKGKVLISINGSVREMEAVTTGNTELKTGGNVKVVRIEGNTLVVTKMD
ncbi:NfeD family protein [Parabacteroides sp. Marseille-P3160]|uniref:NfeD family protein n=1 Tax=Parabacteroides sp. Marseille-P3160 TaxID=1917887 RepID=UPI0009BAACCF|nr:NfeD family protein [Parabacteroides sp. Marseille-P3160]